jgi:MFS family permease
MVRNMAGYRELSRNRDFTSLWLGEAVSQLGSSVSMFAFPLVGYALTGSAVLAGLPMAAFLLGMVTSLLPAGVIVDRADRKRLLLAASGSGVLVYGSVAVAAALGMLTLTHLMLAALLTGVGAGVFGPAEASAVRSVVREDELPTALSQNQARHHIAGLVGGPLGAAMYSASKALPFVFDAVTFLFSFVALTRIRTDLSPVPRPRRRVRADLVEGLRYVWERPYFRTMMAFGALSNLAVNAVFFVAILRLVQEGVHPAAIGVIDMLAGLGGILGALAAPYVIDRLPTGRLTLAVAWSWVPLLVPLVFWSSPVLVGAMLMLGILLNPAGNAGSQSYRVAITPSELQGRVGSSMQFVGMSVMPLAPVAGGFLLERYGGPAATVGLLVLVTATALIPTLSAAVRGIPVPARWPRLDDAPAAAPEPAAA